MTFYYISKRFLRSILVLLAVTLVVFTLVRMIPGDPVRLMLPIDATNEQIENYRQNIGYDKPIYSQYLKYLKNLILGDLGTSLRSKRPVIELIAERLPATIELAFVATCLSLLVALPAGTIAALKRDTVFDKFFMFLTTVGQSIPIFWLGIMLILILSVKMRILPTSGRGTIEQLIMPAVSLAAYFMALLARITRSSVLEVSGQPYVTTARAKGVKENLVIVRHVMRNALIPVITILGLQVGTLLGGAVITETIFAWPGIGSLTIDAIYNRDYPVIQGAILLSAFVFVFINILIDFSYLFLDPRIRYK